MEKGGLMLVGVDDVEADIYIVGSVSSVTLLPPVEFGRDLR